LTWSVLLALTWRSGSALADVVENAPWLPAFNGVYTVPTICMTPPCIENITLEDFVDTCMAKTN
jgi:hypothetical protein